VLPSVASLLRRYSEPVFVLGLLALPVVIFLVNGRRQKPPTAVDHVVITLTAPVEHALVVMASGLVDAWGDYVWLRKVREEDQQLRRQLLRQRAELQLLGEAQAENNRLRSLLDYAERSPRLKLLAAQVIAVGSSQNSRTLRIARGEKEGVRRGMPVISPEGVVGTVAQATGGYSDVQLIVDSQAAVPALSQRGRGRSTVRGTGDLSKCRIDYALRTDELAEGDWLLTAGGEGFYPKGLRIGRVLSVQKKSTGMFIGAELVPAVEFLRLDEVFVVLDQPPEPPPPPAPPPTNVEPMPGPYVPEPLLPSRPGAADTVPR
jgi:rod shape-determining protein MreC